MPRLFFAMEIADSAIPTILSIQEGLRRCVRDDRVRWVPEQKWHVTTHFVGDVSEEKKEQLIEAMALLPHEPIALTTWSIDVFPSTDKPRALVLRLADMSTAAFEAHAAHIPILLREEIAVNPRPWMPHITLGRVRPGLGQLKVHLERVHIPQYTFSVKSITLFESILGSTVRYAPLASVDLPRT